MFVRQLLFIFPDSASAASTHNATAVQTFEFQNSGDLSRSVYY